MMPSKHESGSIMLRRGVGRCEACLIAPTHHTSHMYMHMSTCTTTCDMCMHMCNMYMYNNMYIHVHVHVGLPGSMQSHINGID